MTAWGRSLPTTTTSEELLGPETRTATLPLTGDVLVEVAEVSGTARSALSVRVTVEQAPHLRYRWEAGMTHAPGPKETRTGSHLRRSIGAQTAEPGPRADRAQPSSVSARDEGPRRGTEVC